LTNSYNQGGLISVMALNGLYILITAHGLEYPDFYNKLYALLEPSIFVAKHRARFFEVCFCFYFYFIFVVRLLKLFQDAAFLTFASSYVTMCIICLL
jgi:hypothetical protein